MQVMLNKFPCSPCGCAGLVQGAGDGPEASCALPAPWSILLGFELNAKAIACPCSGNQPHQDPPFHCQTGPGLCTEPANPFLPLRQLRGIMPPLLAVQPGVLQGGSSHGSTAQPQGPPSLLPWRFPAPLCQLQDAVENPGTRNFLTRYANTGVATTICCQERSVPSYAPADKWFLISLHPHALLHPCQNLPCSLGLAGGPGP